jgi:hypothetical protein
MQNTIIGYDAVVVEDAAAAALGLSVTNVRRVVAVAAAVASTSFTPGFSSPQNSHVHFPATTVLVALSAPLQFKHVTSSTLPTTLVFAAAARPPQHTRSLFVSANGFVATTLFSFVAVVAAAAAASSSAFFFSASSCSFFLFSASAA